MGKNCNGFRNRIGGNKTIAKALDIKEDLDIDCLMYCKHQLNFHHKDNKNDLKQMFQWELACMAFSAHNIHKDKHAGGYKKGAQAQSVLENAQDTSGRSDTTTKASADGAGYSWGGRTGTTHKSSWCTIRARTRTSTWAPCTSSNVDISSQRRKT
jgi:hypothetical protein